MEHNTFSETSRDGAARCGVYQTAHGQFETPNFMPVGTKASVKGLAVDRIEAIGTQITLVNTYHLWLRPGPELIRELGGIHKFMSWPGPVLSDSGGFQIYSLQDIRKLDDHSVRFKSHLDGKELELTPEKSVEIQQQLGVDIAMVLDECPDATQSWQKISDSLDLTLRWAERSLAARTAEKSINPEKQTALFGITQGALFPDLRKKAADVLSQLDFDGIAIGGLSVGESREQMYEVLSYHVAELPAAKIHYLMGVGTPEDIVTAVHNGIDLFDCVMPTRSGRFGRAFISGEEPFINIKNQKFSRDSSALDPECTCFCCQRYSKAYLNHLFKVGEMLGPQLLSLHNSHYYQNLMHTIRQKVSAGAYQVFYESEINRWQNFRAVRATKAGK